MKRPSSLRSKGGINHRFFLKVGAKGGGFQPCIRLPALLLTELTEVELEKYGHDLLLFAFWSWFVQTSFFLRSDWLGSCSWVPLWRGDEAGFPIMRKFREHGHDSMLLAGAGHDPKWTRQVVQLQLAG